jgi:ABC-type ATPase involved in cell division
MKKYYTTKQVAEKIGAGHQTLLRWLYAKKLAEPERIIFGGQNLRLWTKDDLQRARTYKVEGAAERRRRSKGRPKKK